MILLLSSLHPGLSLPVSAFCVVSFCPVVSSPTLSKNKIIRSEDLSKWPTANTVHSSGLQVNQNSPWHIFAPGGLIVVYIYSFELKVGCSSIGSCGVNSMLITDDLPEFGSNLISTLAGLEVNDFPHVVLFVVCVVEG